MLQIPRLKNWLKLCKSLTLSNLLLGMLTYLMSLCRMPLIDKSKDMGTVVMGKIESGTVRRGDQLMVMPNKVICWWLLIESTEFHVTS